MTAWRARRPPPGVGRSVGRERLREDLNAFFATEPDAASAVPERAPFAIHLVCAGNICRSPAAEALLRLALQRAGVDASVSSSGLEALVGHPADEPVQRLVAERGADLSRHRARLFERAFAEDADLVLTATSAQCDAVLRIAPAATQRTFALAAFAELVRGADPVGPDGARALIAEASVARQIHSMPHGDIPDPYRRDDQVHRDALQRISAAVGTIAGAFARDGEGRPA